VQVHNGLACTSSRKVTQISEASASLMLIKVHFALTLFHDNNNYKKKNQSEKNVIALTITITIG